MSSKKRDFVMRPMTKGTCGIVHTEASSANKLAGARIKMPNALDNKVSKFGARQLKNEDLSRPRANEEFSGID